MDAAMLTYYIAAGTVYSYTAYRARSDQPYAIHNISRHGYSYKATVNRLTRNNLNRMTSLQGLPALIGKGSSSTSTKTPSATTGTAGVTQLTLTITVKDSNSVPLTGIVENRFAFSGDGDGVIAGYTEVGAGVYTFTLNDATAEAITIAVTVDSVSIGSFATITYS